MADNTDKAKNPIYEPLTGGAYGGAAGSLGDRSGFDRTALDRDWGKLLEQAVDTGTIHKRPTETAGAGGIGSRIKEGTKNIMNGITERIRQRQQRKIEAARDKWDAPAGIGTSNANNGEDRTGGKPHPRSYRQQLLNTYNKANAVTRANAMKPPELFPRWGELYEDLTNYDLQGYREWQARENAGKFWPLGTEAGDALYQRLLEAGKHNQNQYRDTGTVTPNNFNSPTGQEWIDKLSDKEREQLKLMENTMVKNDNNNNANAQVNKTASYRDKSYRYLYGMPKRASDVKAEFKNKLSAYFKLVANK